jgi:CRP-like cAMP-binding protein
MTSAVRPKTLVALCIDDAALSRSGRAPVAREAASENASENPMSAWPEVRAADIEEIADWINSRKRQAKGASPTSAGSPERLGAPRRSSSSRGVPHGSTTNLSFPPAWTTKMDAGFLLLPEFTPSEAAASAPRSGAPRRRSRAGATVQVRRFAMGGVLFAEGDPASEVHELAQGAAMISRRLPDGRRQIVDIVGPGRLFGFTAGDRHDCTAVALSAAVVCSLDRRAAQRDPHIAERIARAMIAEIHRLRDLALLLGCKTAIERVASFFVDLIGDDAQSPSEIRLPVSRVEMGLCLGLTVETVCRNITLLKRSGLIAADGRDTFTIVDRAALRRIAQGKAPRAK